MQRTCRLVKKMTDAKGGVIGRPIEFLFQDTQGDPAMCVRKCAGTGRARQLPHPHRRHRLVRGRRHAAEARRVERRLPLARQRRRPADRRAVRAAVLPRQHVGADGRAHARALSQGRAGEEVHRHRVRCRLGPIQQRRLRGADQGGRQGSGRQDLRTRRQQGLFHLHHQDPAVGRAGLLRGAAGRRGAGVLLAGRPVRPRAARAVLHRDRGAGRHQGARQGFARPGWLVALSRHLRHSGEPRLPRPRSRPSTRTRSRTGPTARCIRR